MLPHSRPSANRHRSCSQSLTYEIGLRKSTKQMKISMNEIVLLVVVGTSIWVLFDAKSIGVKKGQVKGVCDMGVAGWFFACLLLWIISFPAYLAKRPELKRINQKAGSPS